MYQGDDYDEYALPPNAETLQITACWYYTHPKSTQETPKIEFPQPVQSHIPTILTMAAPSSWSSSSSPSKTIAGRISDRGVTEDVLNVVLLQRIKW